MSRGFSRRSRPAFYALSRGAPDAPDSPSGTLGCECGREYAGDVFDKDGKVVSALPDMVGASPSMAIPLGMPQVECPGILHCTPSALPRGSRLDAAARKIPPDSAWALSVRLLGLRVQLGRAARIMCGLLVLGRDIPEPLEVPVVLGILSALEYAATDRGVSAKLVDVFVLLLERSAPIRKRLLEKTIRVSCDGRMRSGAQVLAASCIHSPSLTPHAIYGLLGSDSKGRLLFAGILEVLLRTRSVSPFMVACAGNLLEKGSGDSKLMRKLARVIGVVAVDFSAICPSGLPKSILDAFLIRKDPGLLLHVSRLYWVLCSRDRSAFASVALDHAMQIFSARFLDPLALKKVVLVLSRMAPDSFFFVSANLSLLVQGMTGADGRTQKGFTQLLARVVGAGGNITGQLVECVFSGVSGMYFVSTALSLSGIVVSLDVAEKITADILQGLEQQNAHVCSFVSQLLSILPPDARAGAVHGTVLWACKTLDTPAFQFAVLVLHRIIEHLGENTLELQMVCRILVEEMETPEKNGCISWALARALSLLIPGAYKKKQLNLPSHFDFYTSITPEKVCRWISVSVPASIPRIYFLIRRLISGLQARIHHKEWLGVAQDVTDKLGVYAPGKKAEERKLLLQMSVWHRDRVIKMLVQCLIGKKSRKRSAAASALAHFAASGLLSPVISQAACMYDKDCVDTRVFVMCLIISFLGKSRDTAVFLDAETSHVLLPVVEHALRSHSFCLRVKACVLAGEIAKSSKNEQVGYRVCIHLLNLVFPFLLAARMSKHVICVLPNFADQLSPEFIFRYLMPGLYHPVSRIRNVFRAAYTALVQDSVRLHSLENQVPLFLFSAAPK